MFSLKKSSHDNDLKDSGEYIKVSALLEGSSVDRRKPKKERRLTLERRKTFSSLFLGSEKRVDKLEKRRKAIDRRNEDDESGTTSLTDVLSLDNFGIKILVNQHFIIAKKINRLLELGKNEEFNRLDHMVQDVCDAIHSLMEKEEYFLCLYLDKNKKTLTEVHIERLLSIVHNDISALSDDAMALVEKNKAVRIDQNNFGFIKLDMINVREMLGKCLVKKKSNLYPIYIM
ncbi:MAG: hypothetical protein V3U64_04175 [Cocleimonas sp.]